MTNGWPLFKWINVFWYTLYVLLYMLYHVYMISYNAVLYLTNIAAGNGCKYYTWDDAVLFNEYIVVMTWYYNIIQCTIQPTQSSTTTHVTPHTSVTFIMVKLYCLCFVFYKNIIFRNNEFIYNLQIILTEILNKRMFLLSSFV